jgi:hypothetical protein
LKSLKEVSVFDNQIILFPNEGVIIDYKNVARWTKGEGYRQKF